MEPEEFGQDPAPAESSQDQLASALDSENGNSEQTQTAAPADEFSGHPAFKPIADKLGPIHYRSIENDLREMSRAFEAKIAAQNAKLEPWKQYETVDPGRLNGALTLADRIDADPLAFYQQLEGYLRQNGLLEEAQQVAQAAQQAAGAENEPDPDEDPRIAQLQAQIEQLTGNQQLWQEAQLQQWQQAQFEQSVERESADLGKQIEALKAQGVDDRTIGAIVDRAELLRYRNPNDRTPFAEIYEGLKAERAAILNAPRPVDRAPRLPSVSGGAPGPQATDLSKASRAQSVDTLAALIAANRDN